MPSPVIGLTVIELKAVDQSLAYPAFVLHILCHGTRVVRGKLNVFRNTSEIKGEAHRRS